jgi:hypothetical protein
VSASVNITSYDTLTLELWVRFVDRDMFIRYTHFGVGHPVAVRKMVKDCLGSPAAAPADRDTMDIFDDIDLEEIWDGEGHAELDDEQDSEGEDELSDEELGDEDDEDRDEDDDLFDDLLSF